MLEDLRDGYVLVQILQEPPAVWVQQQRRRGGRGDRQGTDSVSSRERRWPRKLRERKDGDEQHTEDTLAVEVAPQRDHRHAPPERTGRAAGHRPLNEPRARRNPDKGQQVRAWNRARFENEEAQDEDRQRRQRARVDAAREVDEGKRRGDGRPPAVSGAQRHRPDATRHRRSSRRARMCSAAGGRDR